MIAPGARIVDLGCGDGRWLLAAADIFQEYGVVCHGYDLDKRLLETAQVRLGEASKDSPAHARGAAPGDRAAQGAGRQGRAWV